MTGLQLLQRRLKGQTQNDALFHFYIYRTDVGNLETLEQISLF